MVNNGDYFEQERNKSRRKLT